MTVETAEKLELLPVTCRLKQSTHERLAALALDTGRSINETCRNLLAAARSTGSKGLPGTRNKWEFRFTLFLSEAQIKDIRILAKATARSQTRTIDDVLTQALDDGLTGLVQFPKGSSAGGADEPDGDSPNHC
jgi:hypothetical protein